MGMVMDDDQIEMLRVWSGRFNELRKAGAELWRYVDSVASDLERLGPIPVTVDDEHAQPVTGYLLRLPEEMGGGWVVDAPGVQPAVASLRSLRGSARFGQSMGPKYREANPVDNRLAAECYADARWWAEAYSVALKVEAT